jgi:hypothetical protein
MSVDAHKQKAKAKLDEQKAAIESAKAKLGGLTADARIEAEKQLGKLEDGYEAAKLKMADLADAGEDAWEEFAKGVESTWGSVTASVKKLFS